MLQWSDLTQSCCRQTMIRLLGAPRHASIPDLLMLVAHAGDFDSIRLRRGEKKVLNAINKSVAEGRIRFCVPSAPGSQKHKQRITSGPEKIFILVRLLIEEEPSNCIEPPDFRPTRSSSCAQKTFFYRNTLLTFSCGSCRTEM